VLEKDPSAPLLAKLRPVRDGGAFARVSDRRQVCARDNAPVSDALPAVSLSAVVGQWAVQPLALVTAVLVVGWYLRAVRLSDAQGVAWPPRRTGVFLLGVGLFLWVTCGVAQAYARSLFSVWTAQTLALLFVVPVVLLAGQPVELARRRVGERGRVARVLRSRFGRVLANPLVGPTVIPVLSAVLFFGPLPGWAVGVAPVGWVAATRGGRDRRDDRVSRWSGFDADEVALAVGLALIIGMVELIVDAIPGIVLRLQSHVATTFFAHRTVHPWSPRPLHDQQIAGATLWCVAEIIDLPFLVLMFRRWLRADRREAAATDAVLDAERLARASVPQSPTTGSGAGAVDSPWWLTDPALRDRFRE